VSDEHSKPGSGAPGERMELPSLNRGRTKKRGGGEPQEDAFQVGVKEVGRGAARRAPLVVGGAILGIVALVVGVVLYARGEKASAAATRVLAEAATYEARAEVGDPELLLGKSKRSPPNPVVKDEAERAAAVDKALAELSTQAPGSKAELDGLLMAAARQMRDGKPAEAEASYRKFLDNAGAGHPMRWAAREGLGFAREAQDDLDGALAEFVTLAGDKGVFYRDMGLWHQGRVLERQGKSAEALAIYRQYIAEYPLTESSIAQSEVRKRLEELDPSAVTGAAADSPIQMMDMPPGATP
jgi:tetratricopeptide (TPR) repeat protein